MQRSRKGLGVALFGTLALFLAFQSGVARAETIVPTLVGSPTMTFDGFWMYTYDVDITGNSALIAPGSQFVIYDFNQFVRFEGDGGPGSPVFAVPGGGFFIGTVQNLGPYYPNSVSNPTPLMPGVDSAAILNMVFTYTGPQVNAEADLGEVRIVSGQQSIIEGEFGSQDYVRNPSTGLISGLDGRVDAVFVPAAGGPPIVPLPLAAWGGIGLFGLIGGSKLRAGRVRSA
jgi:hypothetical protein